MKNNSTSQKKVIKKEKLVSNESDESISNAESSSDEGYQSEYSGSSTSTSDESEKVVELKNGDAKDSGEDSSDEAPVKKQATLPKKESVPVNEDDVSSTGEGSKETSDSEVSSDSDDSEKVSSESEADEKKSTEVSSSVGKTVFMKNFGPTITDDMIRTELSKFGKITELRVPRKRDQDKNRGFLICCFEKAESLVKVLKLNGTEFLNCTIYVEELKDGLKSREDHTTARTDKKEGSNNTGRGQQSVLFVGNIPYEFDEHDFKKYVTEQGNVVNIRIPQDRETGRKRGFCFFEFENRDEMNAFSKKNLVWDDRKLVMKVSEPAKREERSFDKRDNNRRGNDRQDFTNRRDNDDRRGRRDDGDRKGGRDNNDRGNRFNKENKSRFNEERGGKRNFDRKDNNRSNEGSGKKIKFEDSSD